MKQQQIEWLIKKKATPTEVKIFKYALKVCRGEKFYFKNGDILALHGTSRTNIRQNLARMIDKGMIVKNSFHTYRPVRLKA